MSTIETIAARDGTALLTRAWPATGDPWGSILVVHGLGEHSGRHDATGGRFAAAGLATTSFDHRGFRGLKRPACLRRALGRVPEDGMSSDGPVLAARISASLTGPGDRARGR